ncbi:MAG: hypothetical protein ACRDD1_19245 [Planctomycetia bacterium]
MTILPRRSAGSSPRSSNAALRSLVLASTRTWASTAPAWAA